LKTKSKYSLRARSSRHRAKIPAAAKPPNKNMNDVKELREREGPGIFRHAFGSR
jgi:hypothetical protein